MTLSGVFEALTQRKTEADAGFREELVQYARRGLTVIGCIEFGMTTIAVVLKLLRFDYPHKGAIIWWPTALFLTLGLAALLGARWAPGRYVRGIGIALGIATVGAILGADISATHGLIGEKLLANVLTVMLVGVACLPLTPVQSMLFNGFAVVTYAGAWDLARRAGMNTPDDIGVITLTILGGVCIFLSAVSYGRLAAAFQGHRQALLAAEEVRGSELRACNAESAMTNVRLAAALSHELNTPLGALKSAVQTITSAAGRMPGASNERQERLARVAEDAGGVAIHAAARLESVVRRIQRFSNLDGADQQSINLPAMLSDIVMLPEGSEANSRVDTEFGAVPAFTGQPQAYSAIFSTLIRKALDASGADGRVTIRTRHVDPWIVLEIEHGRVDHPVDFQLGFAVEDDRVSAANWDLFSARQVIRANGGEIEAASGSLIRVRLPVHAATAATAAG